MRKVTQKSALALCNSTNMKSGNTEVKNNAMYLHGNTIAIFDSINDKLTLRDCGWNTATTKERLNGLLWAFGSELRIYQQNGKWYTTDGCGSKQPWNGNITIEV